MIPARIQRAVTGLGLVLAATSVPACNSDEVLRAAEDETTEESTTDTPETTGEESTEDTGPPPDKTCRDGIQCLLACAAGYPANPTPEDPTLEDFLLACFLECGQDLDAQQSLAMIKLVSCVSDSCYGNGSCVTGQADEQCTICLAAGLLDDAPPGCEAEAEACQ